MTAALLMLDQALEIGRRELELLLSGDIEQAGKLAQDRSGLISAALDADGADQDKQVLRGRLKELQALQDSLTSQAKRLRDETREEMLKVKQESRRIGGYKSGVGLGTGRRSRFVSKRG